MDLIYTNANRVDLGVISAYAFDLSFGADENDFEMTLGKTEAVLEGGAFIYIEGTEYGGIVDATKTNSSDENITYTGRTWHGMLNSKVIKPNAGEAYFIVSGDANEVLSVMVDRLGLGDLFSVDTALSGINISRYQFPRYCKGYDGIKNMLLANGAKLKMIWQGRAVVLSAAPVVDYTASPVDNDETVLSVEKHDKKVNHLVCLGKGELTAREVIHLYVDQFGRIGNTQYFFGLDEIEDIYDNSNTDNLRNDGIARLKELRDSDNADFTLSESLERAYDIGDIVGATETQSGVSVNVTVTKKIVKINNGAIRTEYKTGG